MSGPVSRRSFLEVSGLALAAGGLGELQLAAQGQLFAYVGRATPGFAGASEGGGIDVFRVNMGDGSLDWVSATGPEVQDLNSDGMCVSADGRFLYCVNRTTALEGIPGTGGGVAAFAINRADGALRHLNTRPSWGAMPIGVRIDRTNSRVIVGNHGAVSRVVLVRKRDGVPVIERPTDDGTVAMYPLNPDGSLGPVADVSVFDEPPVPGSEGLRPAAIGPTGGVQIGPSCHQVAFDRTERWIIATDNGYDHIYVYSFSPTARTLEGRAYPAPPGKAPRHIAVHPRAPYFFITNEREPSVSSYQLDPDSGEVELVQTGSRRCPRVTPRRRTSGSTPMGGSSTAPIGAAGPATPSRSSRSMKARGGCRGWTSWKPAEPDSGSSTSSPPADSCSRATRNPAM